MKKFASIEPEEDIKFEESTREQYTFHPITAILGAIVLIVMILVAIRVVYEILQPIFY